MKDKTDNQTGDLLKSPAARRQAAFSERQRALGRKQRSFWLNDLENELVAELLKNTRNEATK